MDSFKRKKNLGVRCTLIKRHLNAKSLIPKVKRSWKETSKFHGDSSYKFQLISLKVIRVSYLFLFKNFKYRCYIIEGSVRCEIAVKSSEDPLIKKGKHFW